MFQIWVGIWFQHGAKKISSTSKFQTSGLIFLALSQNTSVETYTIETVLLPEFTPKTALFCAQFQ